MVEEGWNSTEKERNELSSMFGETLLHHRPILLLNYRWFIRGVRGTSNAEMLIFAVPLFVQRREGDLDFAG
jgi:hypothetical protein